MASEQFRRIRSAPGFIAALDQSGGSTPKALALYGIDPSSYSTEREMFDLIHDMRSRLIKSPAFAGDRVIGAILFAATLDRTVAGKPTASYLWNEKGIVPFVKVDQGLADVRSGVQLMKELTELDALLEHAVASEVFGTKMRSVIHEADRQGIADVVEQQFSQGRRILDAGLVPIIEPEVSITSPTKPEAEDILVDRLTSALASVDPATPVMLKLTLPTVPGRYAELMDHPAVLRVVALSGGYSRQEACRLLSMNPGLIASFSRALTEGLRSDQTQAEFDRALEVSVSEIFAASTS